MIHHTLEFHIMFAFIKNICIQAGSKISGIASIANDVIMDVLFPRRSSPTIMDNLRMVVKECKEQFDLLIINGTSLAKDALFPKLWSDVTKESNVSNLSAIEYVGENNTKMQTYINYILRKEIVCLKQLLVSQEERIQSLEKMVKFGLGASDIDQDSALGNYHEIDLGNVNTIPGEMPEPFPGDLIAWMKSIDEELPVLLEWEPLNIPTQSRKFRWKKSLINFAKTMLYESIKAAFIVGVLVLIVIIIRAV